MDMDMMPMYFQFTQKATILFKDWSVNSVGGIVGSFFAVFFMALFFEAFKTLRDIVTARYKRSIELLSKPPKGVPQLLFDYRYILLLTLMQMVQLTWAYFLMLIVMTYNVWLCFGVVLGDGVGYLIFFNRRPLALTTQDEDCCGS